MNILDLYMSTYDDSEPSITISRNNLEKMCEDVKFLDMKVEGVKYISDIILNSDEDTYCKYESILDNIYYMRINEWTTCSVKENCTTTSIVSIDSNNIMIEDMQLEISMGADSLRYVEVAVVSETSEAPTGHVISYKDYLTLGSTPNLDDIEKIHKAMKENSVTPCIANLFNGVFVERRNIFFNPEPINLYGQNFYRGISYSTLGNVQFIASAKEYADYKLRNE